MIEALAQDASTVLLTLRVATVAVLLGLLPAVVLAAFLAHRTFPGRNALLTLLNLPLVLPPVATGLALLVLLAPSSPLGHWLAAGLGVTVVFSWTGAAVAAGAVSFPLMLRAMILGFESIDRRYTEVARTLGTPPLMVWWRVHLPLALPAILSGCLVAFARALGEFGATMIVAGSIPGRTRTLSLDLFHRIETGDQAGALRLVAIAALLAFVLLALGRAAERRVGARTGR